MSQTSAALPKEGSKMKISWVKVIGTIAAVVVFFVVKGLSIPDVSPQGQGALALLAASVIVWVIQPVPIGYSSIVAMVLAWVLGYVPMETALSGFAGSTFWLLFAACGMGACISASGLAKRLALSILSVIGKPTFKRVLAAIYVTTFLMGFIIPSVLAKSIAILAVFLPLVPMFGVELKSNIGKAITLSVLMLGYVGNGVLPTAGINAIMVYGGLTGAGYVADFAQWALVGVLPVLVIFVATYFFMLWWAKPEVKEVSGGREGIREQMRSLPKMSVKEIWALVVTVTILLMWVFDAKLLNLGSAAIGVLGVMLYLLPGIGSMSFDEFIHKAIPWNILIMVGAIIGVAAIVPHTGVAPVIGNMLLPVLSLATTPVGLVLAALILNLIQWPLMIIVPTIPLVMGPLVEAGAAIGMTPEAVAVFYLMFFPQFFFWAFAPFTALAFKDGAAELKDWLIVSAVIFVFTVVTLFLTAILWLPIVS